MAKKKKCPECPAGEKWAVPYADFLSLLLALFIALYAISAQNTEKVKALKEEFIKIFDYAPKPEQAQPVLPMITESSEIQSESSNQEGGDLSTNRPQESVADKIQKGGILEQVEEGTILKLPTNLLFPIHMAELHDKDTELFFQRIVQIIQRLPKDVKIDVRGFAENPNIANTEFKTNYQLASARAMFVMNTLIHNGISPERIFFSSQGKYGKQLQGKNEKETLLKNNRVEIYFFVSEKYNQKTQEFLNEISKIKN